MSIAFPTCHIQSAMAGRPPWSAGRPPGRPNPSWSLYILWSSRRRDKRSVFVVCYAGPAARKNLMKNCSLDVGRVANLRPIADLEFLHLMVDLKAETFGQQI